MCGEITCRNNLRNMSPSHAFRHGYFYHAFDYQVINKHSRDQPPFIPPLAVWDATCDKKYSRVATSHAALYPE